MVSQGGELVTIAGGLGGGGLGGGGVLSPLSSSEVDGGRAMGSSLVILLPTSLTVLRPWGSVSTVTRPVKFVLTKEFPSSRKNVLLDKGIQFCCGGGGGGGGGEEFLAGTGRRVVMCCNSGGPLLLGGPGGGGGGGGGGGDLGLKALTGVVAKNKK